MWLLLWLELIQWVGPSKMEMGLGWKWRMRHRGSCEGEM